MRSSDAWLGWPYDAFNFTCISIYTLLQLMHQHRKTYKLGNLSINAGSQHLYERNWKKQNYVWIIYLHQLARYLIGCLTMVKNL